MAVNLRRHRNLIAWAKERGLFVRVDRATPWGHTFELERRSLLEQSARQTATGAR